MAKKMKPGETRRFTCGSCNQEFEVTYEPKAKTASKEAVKGLADSTTAPQCCPFCHALALEEDD